MGFSTLRLFCTAEELTGWVRDVAQRHELSGLVFRESRIHALGSERTWRLRPGAVVAGDAIAVDAEVFGIFLMPAGEAPTEAIAWNDLVPRAWLEVRPGHVLRRGGERVLLETVMSAPTSTRSAAKPRIWLGWLKRRLKADGVVAGVVVGDAQLGGARRNAAVRYSRSALRLHRAGTVWKQLVDGNVVFSPVPAEQEAANRAS